MEFLVVLGAFLCLSGAVLGQLGLNGVKCGSKYCKFTEYCSDFDKLCQPCSSICDVNHHNLDTKKCEEDCQDYLHEIRYGMSQSADDSALRAEVRYLHTMVSITLALICIILACMGITIIFRFMRWKKKHQVNMAWIRSKFNSKKKTDKLPTVSVTQASGKPDLRLDMPPVLIKTPGTNTSTPSTASTNISRRPAEDSTLDYAYDNPAMTTTPSPNNKTTRPHESSL